MRVHHLNCGSMCPAGGLLPASAMPAHMPCHCLLIETEQGLVLVDTGMGTADAEDPKRLGVSRFLLNASGDPAETAIRQVEALGFRASDVQHIVATHLDLDHAGGVPDFPHAKVHLLDAEWRAAHERATMPERSRYRPVQFADHADWARYEVGAGERWFGFEAVRELEGLPPELLLIPLPGHSRGHAGVAVDTGDGWLLHAGDAFFDRHTITGGKVPWAVSLFERLTAIDRHAAAENRARLAELHAASDGVRIFCAHDGVQLQELLGE